MHGDFSRSTFDRTRHVSAVLHQQGRVTLDADHNEQAQVLLHHLRTVVADLVGPAGVPAGEQGGFAIGTVAGPGEPDLTISAGRMYVDGILVENEQDTTYWGQPDGHLDPDEESDRLPPEPYLVYLRVWERLVTALEEPAIREVALGDLGPDTAARSRVVWQVAASPTTLLGSSPPAPPTAEDALTWLLESFQREDDELPVLQAQARRPDSADDSVCDLSPEARYRGPENQLYRVQVHTGGTAQPLPAPEGRGKKRSTRVAATPGGATFVFSRDNAARAVFPVDSLAGNQVQLSSLGRDGASGLEVGDRVEIVDDASASRVADDVLRPSARSLRRVQAVDAAARLVTLEDDPGAGTSPHQPGTRPDLHPLLRRWDHGPTAQTEDGRILAVDADGALPLLEDVWIDLEDGVRIRFGGGAAGGVRQYRPGDHWCIPARVVPGDVLWPEDDEGPALRPPDGVEYHYAPLAWVEGGATDLRVLFSPVAVAPRRRSTRRAPRRPTPPTP